jgi:hypothetical protein
MAKTGNRSLSTPSQFVGQAKEAQQVLLPSAHPLIPHLCFLGVFPGKRIELPSSSGVEIALCAQETQAEKLFALVRAAGLKAELFKAAK